ncbi:iron complex outermembrane recepter protein [Roseivivax halotolerans]|uniref:Iron complex outermembrane recepter protein n=1 Tax=Roseivivax halotolerans TaxID=93684 RepID=A0A1I5Z7V7_9RHOB|nr:TonB-dependent siderophore receptor [Roseivivax halotolerans]SFQ52534.1 iron complex outermembrane recepter protein [Roseivivax halotolerans]
MRPRTDSVRRALITTTILTGCVVQPAFAQQGEVDLGQITFEVQGAEPVGNDANPNTLSGVKTATEITAVPQSVSVVGREAFGRENPSKVDQVLRDVSGVQSQLYGYDSDTNWFYLRGFNSSDTGAFMDGLSLFSYGFGTFYIDPFLLDRVEVLKGPSSMLYGASSPGGVVNYVSKLPDGDEGRSLTFGADSEGRAWLQGEVAGLAGPDLSYRFGGKLQRQDGHGMFEPGLEGVIYGGGTKAFADGSKLTLHLSYTDMDEDHVGGQFLPYFGTEKKGPFGHFDEYYNGGDPDEDAYDREQLIATGIYRRDVAGWQMTDTFRLGYADLEELYVYPNGFTSGQVPSATADVNRFVFAHDSYATIAQNDLRFTRQIETGGATHDLLVGLDMRRYRLDEEQAFALGTPLDPDDPSYDADQPEVGAPYIDGVRVQDQVGLYAQDQIRWGSGWIGTVNARYDKVWSSFEDELGPDLDREDEAFTWRLALAREFGTVTPYATVGTYFNPQALSADSRDAEPEEGRQIEVGVKWQPNPSSLVTFSAFDITRENVSQSLVNGGTFDSRTLGEVRSRGIELEADWQATEAVRLSAAYTNLDVEIVDFEADPSIEGKTPQSVIEEFGSVQLAYTPLSFPDLELRAGARYRGDSWADNANTLDVDGAWLFDAGATWDFAEDWTADLNVTNIGDERYTASCQTSFGTSSCWQGEGRVVSLGVTRSF